MGSKQPPEPEWLAKPSGECCLKGHIHTGNPRGKFEWHAEVETYVSHPPAEKNNGNVVLYFPDVYGFFTNGLLVMDSLADAGYTVVGIDYFQGDPVYIHRTDAKTAEPGFDFEAWMNKYHKIAEKIVPPWIAAVKKAFGNDQTRYACTGYCFGAPYVMNSLSNGDCSVGAFGHPAFLKEAHFRAIKAPLFLSCAETDFTFGLEQRNRALEILTEDKKDYVLQLFSGVSHGFALRCNLEVKYEVYCKEESLRGIIGYFDYWTGLDSKER